MRILGLCFVCIFIISGCSLTDLDDVQDAAQSQRLPAFKGLLTTADALVEVNYDGIGDAETYSNLTLQENFPFDFEFVHRQADVFGLYRFQNVWIRDVENGATEQFLDYTPPGNSERREGVVNDNVHIALLYRRQDALSDLQLRLINVQNNVQQNVNFGALSGISHVYLSENTVIVTLDDLNDDSTRLFVINVGSGVIQLDTVFPNTESTAVVFGEDADFYFFDGVGTSYRYNIATQELITSAPSAFRGRSGRYYKIEDNRIESDFFYVQPSFFERGPQLFDLETNEALRVDIATSLTILLNRNENGSQIVNTNFAYDKTSQTWLVNYRMTSDDGTLNEFGILQLSMEGEILNQLVTQLEIASIVGL